MPTTATPKQPFGILLVTSAPPLVNGRVGSALDLVRARLAAKVWPIYRHTRSRNTLRIPGIRLAFYVAGQGELAGYIVATAAVEKELPSSRTARPTDPPQYLTDVPSIVLALKDIHLLAEPVCFPDVLPRLSLNPGAKVRSWGIVVQGGARPLTRADWGVLFGG